jgi:SpoIID/LytB domain protein
LAKAASQRQNTFALTFRGLVRAISQRHAVLSFFWISAALCALAQSAPSPDSARRDSNDLPMNEVLPTETQPENSEPPVLAPAPETLANPLLIPSNDTLPVPQMRASVDTLHGVGKTPPFPEALDSLTLRFPYRPEFLSPAWDSVAKALALQAAAAAAEVTGGHTSKGPVPVAKLPLPLNRPVRVLLKKTSQTLTVNLHGDFGLARLDGPQAIPQAVVVRGKTTLTVRGRDVDVTDASGTRTLRNCQGIRLNPARMGTYFDLDGIPYRGSVDIASEWSSTDVVAVNVLPMDDYLRGVLPYELGRVDVNTREALNALAVVARTYAMRRMLRPAANRFDLYDDVQDQVYKGMKDEYALSDAAVRDTRGQVLLYADTLVQAYYSSTCGGKTASRHEVWDGPSYPYLKTRDDHDAQGKPWCQASPLLTWQQSWTSAELAGILKRNYAAGRAEGPKEFKSIQSIRVAEKFSDGRIKTLLVQSDAGAVTLRGDKIRWALKPKRSDGRILESAAFTISQTGSQITFQGRGFGHGVGLCQYGAMGRARAGQNYRDILAAYFAGTRVVEYR